jgi:hypothetical protein
MKNLVMSAIIGLGLVVGFGAMSNEVNACDNCVIERIETEEHEDCICGSFQLQCENCGGLYCQEYACECGRCEGIICEEPEEKNVVMTYDELMIFNEMIWDIYCEEYCTNYCEECDYYYYTECMCDACDCEDCLNYDYELFVEDANESECKQNQPEINDGICTPSTVLRCEVCEKTGTELKVWYDSNNVKHYTCTTRCTNGLGVLYGE